MGEFDLRTVQPHLRYVNNYKPTYSYVEQERIIYDYELMYVMEGEVEMCYDGRTYLLQKGDIFYLKPFVRNYITVEERKGFRTHCIHFDWMPPTEEEDFTAEEVYMHSVTMPGYQERLERLKHRRAEEPIGMPKGNHISDIPYDKLAPLFAACYRYYSAQDAVSMLHARSLLLEIIAVIAEHTAEKSRLKIVHPKIMAAINEIRDNYIDRITVEGLAVKYRMSPKYFGTLFKEATGKSVNEYVLSLRMYDAREMLLGTDMTIEEIAEKTGFQNVFYFSRCFKQQMKVSPSVFRDMG